MTSLPDPADGRDEAIAGLKLDATAPSLAEQLSWFGLTAERLDEHETTRTAYQRLVMTGALTRAQAKDVARRIIQGLVSGAQQIDHDGSPEEPTPTGLALSPRDRRILGYLSADGGWATADIATEIEGSRTREGSARLRQDLVRLEAAGLVARMDDQRPIAWVRTAAGLAALVASERGSV